MESTLSQTPYGQPDANALVMKFGGTSVGSVEAINATIDIIQQARIDHPRLVLVASAVSGITSLLLESAVRALGDDYNPYTTAEILLNHHQQLAEKLVIDPMNLRHFTVNLSHLVDCFIVECRGINTQGKASPRALDAIAALGERISVRLLSATLASRHIPAQAVDATQLIVTDNAFQNAHPDLTATKYATHQVLDPLLDSGILPVVTGFIAATQTGITTTLGRGGSDYSASILGAVLPAEDIWIWTDVDGVMTTDPRLISQAHTISEITFHEIFELAAFGAKVLHPKTIFPILGTGIGLRICNTFNPAHPGTRVVESNRSAGGITAIAVSAKIPLIPDSHSQEERSTLTAVGPGLCKKPWLTTQIFDALACAGIPVLGYIFGTTDASLNLTIRSLDIAPALNILHNMILNPDNAEKANDRTNPRRHSGSNRKRGTAIHPAP